MSNAVQPVTYFRPSVSLYDNPCPMSVAFQKPEIQLASDRSSLSPAPPTYSAWNYHDPENFFLILGYVVFTSLSYTFDFDSLLLTKDMSC